MGRIARDRNAADCKFDAVSRSGLFQCPFREARCIFRGCEVGLRMSAVGARRSDRCLRQTGASKITFAIAVMLHLRAPYVSKTAILGCRVCRSGQKSKSRLNSKDLDRWVSY